MAPIGMPVRVAPAIDAITCLAAAPGIVTSTDLPLPLPRGLVQG